MFHRRRQDLKRLAACGMLRETAAEASQPEHHKRQRRQQPGRPPPPTDAEPNMLPGAAPAATSLHAAAARPGSEKLLAQLLQQGRSDVWERNAQGLQPLHVAAAAGHRRAVAALLAHEPRLVDSTTPDRRTALFIAAEHGQIAAAEELLQAGADANLSSGGGANALHVAAGRQDGELLVRLLLNAGADAAAADSQGRTALHVAAAAACHQAGSLGSLLCLSRHSPSLLGKAAADGSTPLHAICHSLQSSGTCRSMHALQKLAGSSLLSCRRVLNAAHAFLTPLALAARAGSLPAVRLLISAGADPNPSSWSCWACSTTIHTAGFEVEQMPELGGSHACASHDQLQQATDGHTCPLGIAASRRDYPLMLALLAAGTSAAGLSSHVLGSAIADARAVVAAALLRAGLRCDPVRPLLAAVERGDEQMLAALLTAGLDPNCAPEASTALLLLTAALQPGREALLRLLLTGPPGQPAPAAACRPPQHGQYQRQVLDVAALAQDLEVNPASYAVRRSSLCALRQLLAAGCPAGAVPAGSGQPPVVEAAGRLDEARCRVLLEAGAQPNERNCRGETALDVVLSLCTDAELVHLAAEEHGSPSPTERQLLLLVELLAGAGASCEKFLADHQAPDGCADLGLVHGSLHLAASPTAWSPASHHRWPAPFRQAASAALLVLRGRGAQLACSAGVGGCSLAASQQQGGRVQLPLELCHMILSHAARPLSCWVRE